ncbi:MAG: glycoside hydrolase family 3 C-terminal domain-containing protein [Clostridia bacterium]|nr:glycoside hydrolase family 3 C-terminal domain-containing protein [Clostridia bacterium]
MLPYQNAELDIETRVKDLLGRMTLEEKVGQLDMKFGHEYCTKHDPNYRLSVDPESGYDYDRLEKDFGASGLGYVHDNYSVPSVMNKIQRFFVEKTRLGIPVIFTGEALHGINGTRGTILPNPTAWAASFDTESGSNAGRVIAAETRALGIHEILAPNLDVARDPRWGRTEETFGEDTYLSSRFAAAVIAAEQKDDISRNDSVIAEPKHYCVHGVPEGGVNCAPARVGIREVENCYLPVFEAGVKEGGAYDVMVCYNSIDGEVVITSEHYLKEVLKERLGLRGICRSDWSAVERVKELHHLTEDDKETIYLTKKNGLDCLGGCECSHAFWVKTLCELVNEGRIEEENINESCRRVLRLKFLLGLFENPYTDETRWESVVHCEAHRDIALELARKSVTLLKNDGVLPLNTDKIKKIAVIGPSGNHQQIGNYSCVPVYVEIASVYEELKKALPGIEIVQADGCGISAEIANIGAAADQPHLIRERQQIIEDALDEAVEIAKNADVIVFVGGDDVQSSGECHDRCEMTLYGRQRELIERLCELGAPVILVLENGRPLEISKESEICAAVLETWFGGEKGAEAIADALLGKINPGGKLPFSLPRKSGMIPCYYSMLPGKSDNYLEGDGKALYPFGFGLSYTTFAYSDLVLTRTGETDVDVCFTVENTGERTGDEVVQIYVDDCESSVVTPPLLLKAFRRVTLAPGEKKTLHFSLDKNAFRLMNAKYEWVVEPGKFRICAASSSRDIKLAETIVL